MLQSTFWLSPSPFVAPVSILLLRRSSDSSQQTHRLAGGWRQRGESHFLRYELPVDPTESTTGSRTVLKLHPASLELFQYGELQWHHTFVQGKSTADLVFQGASVPMQVHTLRVRIRVHPFGGRVDLMYRLDWQGFQEEVDLQMEFSVIESRTQSQS